MGFFQEKVWSMGNQSPASSFAEVSANYFHAK